MEYPFIKAYITLAFCWYKQSHMRKAIEIFLITIFTVMSDSVGKIETI